MSIGSRSQSSRTYLERNLAKFEACDLEELVIHGLSALQDSLPNELSLSDKNVSIGYVSKGEPFRILSPQENEEYIKKVPRLARQQSDEAPAPAAAAAQPPQDQ